MTVQELIDILTGEVKEVDRSSANVEIWCDNQQYEIESMRGFSLSPDITVYIKTIESPIFSPARFKKEHEDMIKNKMKEIMNGEIDV